MSIENLGKKDVEIPDQRKYMNYYARKLTKWGLLASGLV